MANSPIKDVKIIEQIMKLYKNKYKLLDLLLFGLVVDIGYGLFDLIEEYENLNLRFWEGVNL